ncbi:uncharacterized protein C8R40DRAFT_1178088 [Lentinula edodes]|uniref:uncharacterized protein n=1 Tax=Lentinula edodes TaxID=5353 RepID=UPI001E8EAB33|nr:uncharacterized protein C8R40DRAFT_1178088 [Lentinula edodes]KAH7868158.1 hypothetical protein C8R40DRAFT_1178088 [Lentinula edodes]
MPPNTVTAVWADSSTSKSFEFKSEKMLEFSARAHLNKLVSPLPAGQCETLPSGSLENVETAAVLFHPSGTTLVDEILKKFTAVTEVRLAKVEGDLEKKKSGTERLLAKITGLEGREESLQKENQSLKEEQRQERVRTEGREKSLLAKITGVEGREEYFRKEIQSLKEEQRQERVRTEGREKSLLAKITGVEGREESLQKENQSLKEEQGQERVRTEGREKSLLAKITGVEGREESLQKEIQSLKEEQRQQRVRTSSLEDEITRLSGDFDDWITIGDPPPVATLDAIRQRNLIDNVQSHFATLAQLPYTHRKLASEAFRKAIGNSSTEDRLEAAKALLHGHCIDLPSDNALLLLVDESKRRLGNNVAHQRYSRAWYLEIVTKEQGNAELIDILFPNP